MRPFPTTQDAVEAGRHAAIVAEKHHESVALEPILPELIDDQPDAVVHADQDAGERSPLLRYARRDPRQLVGRAGIGGVHGREGDIGEEPVGLVPVDEGRRLGREGDTGRPRFLHLGAVVEERVLVSFGGRGGASLRST